MLFHRKNGGFTLLEAIVAVAIFALIAGASFAASASFLTDSARISSAKMVAQHLRLAQMRAMTGYRQSDWGFHFGDGAFSVFRGNSYTGRDSAFDIVVDLPSSVAFSDISLQGGGGDIVFERMTGETLNYGTFILSDGNGNEVSFSVNALGVIDS